MVLMGCRIRVGPLHIAGDICRCLLMHCGYRLTRQLYLSLRPGSYKSIAISGSQLSWEQDRESGHGYNEGGVHGKIVVRL